MCCALPSYGPIGKADALPPRVCGEGGRDVLRQPSLAIRSFSHGVMLIAGCDKNDPCLQLRFEECTQP